jgi:hypothetical protein
MRVEPMAAACFRFCEGHPLKGKSREKTPLPFGVGHIVNCEFDAAVHNSRCDTMDFRCGVGVKSAVDSWIFLIDRPRSRPFVEW